MTYRVKYTRAFFSPPHDAKSASWGPGSEERMYLRLRSALTLAVLIIAPLAGHIPALTTDIAAQAQAIDPVLLNAYRWRSIGPDRGGRSIAVAGVKGRPREAYFGAVGGGLWKTTDAGNTWAPVTDGQISSSSIGAVAVSESHPDIVFIGMGENCIRGKIGRAHV